jgi:hypothetical protein
MCPSSRPGVVPAATGPSAQRGQRSRQRAFRMSPWRSTLVLGLPGGRVSGRVMIRRVARGRNALRRKERSKGAVERIPGTRKRLYQFRARAGRYSQHMVAHGALQSQARNDGGKLSVREPRCPNLNHGRTWPLVHACPDCGALVNAKIPAKLCGDAKHAARRKDGNAFCADCSARLRIEPR